MAGDAPILEETERPSNAGASRAQRLVAAGAFLLLFLLGLDTLRPPACGDGAAADSFSCEKALAHARIIAAYPHPAFMDADRAAREYILHELTAIGLSPQVQTAVVIHPRSSTRLRLHNILARLPGTAPGKAVLLVCHYDSAPGAPGAGDDGAAVGVLLETMRVLKSGPPLRNDVVLLVTDGEELGLLGARAFIADHPWAKDVGVVLNFDGRGTAGPCLMYETSEGNAELVRRLATIVRYPVATSVAADIYRRMPNDTDFTVFRKAGGRGLNFGFVRDYVYYHTPGDSLEHLDPTLVAHEGACALPLARHFANADLSALHAGPGVHNAVYFNLARRVLMVYDTRWIWPLTSLVLIGTTALLVWGFRSGRLSFVGMIEAMGRMLAGVVVSVSLVYATQRGARWVLMHYPGFRDAPFYEACVIVFAAVATLATVLTAVVRRRRAGAAELAAAALLVWALLSIPASLYLPGGTYLVQWPVLPALFGLWVTLRSAERPPLTWGGILGVILASAPALLLLPAIVYMMFTALTIFAGAIVAPVATLVVWLLAGAGWGRLFIGALPVSRAPAKLPA